MSNNGNRSIVQQAAPNTVARQDAFGGQELAVSGEVQALALAAQAEANVKARWAIAQHKPRNMDQVRLNLLRECDRPSFAAVAKFAKPVGKKTLEGPSIRFVEAALRAFGNNIADATVISEDQRSRRIQVAVTDLEANVSYTKQITIEKVVERRELNGRQSRGSRSNSYGELVYLVDATEDDLATKEAAIVSKAIRSQGMRVLPGDLVDECMARVAKTLAAEVKKDPDAARKKIIDSFAEVGVKPDQLVEYLGHTLDHFQPVELTELRQIYNAIKDGESKWADVMDAKRELEPRTQAPPPPPAQPTQPPSAQSQAPAPTVEVVESMPPAWAPTDETQVLLDLIASCVTNLDLAKKVAPVMAKAKPEVQLAVKPAYHEKAKELAAKARGGK
jgi:hypothetical protein